MGVVCDICGNKTKRYDRVLRQVKHEGGRIEWIWVCRYRCTVCNHLQRDLPAFVIRHKHYSRDVIQGVLQGFLTPYTLSCEDYPCEMTMKRWLRVA